MGSGRGAIKKGRGYVCRRDGCSCGLCFAEHKSVGGKLTDINEGKNEGNVIAATKNNQT